MNRLREIVFGYPQASSYARASMSLDGSAGALILMFTPDVLIGQLAELHEQILADIKPDTLADWCLTWMAHIHERLASADETKAEACHPIHSFGDMLSAARVSSDIPEVLDPRRSPVDFGVDVVDPREVVSAHIERRNPLGFTALRTIVGPTL
jgi:hypothetical protein